MSNVVPYVQAIMDAEQSFIEMEEIAAKQNTLAPVAFNQEKKFAVQIVQANNYLQRDQFNRSLCSAVGNVALCGITLNPAMKLAYLVPRNGAICLDISYMGLIKIATDSGSVDSVQAHLVYEKDEFAIDLGTNKQITHRPDPFADRGKVVGVYVIARLPNGEELYEPMSIKECHAIRDRSEAWKALVAKKTKSCPWLTDEGEMMRKTVVKRAYKYWPKTQRLSQAINVLNEHEGYDNLEPYVEPQSYATDDDLEGEVVMSLDDKRDLVFKTISSEAKALGVKVKDYAGSEYSIESTLTLSEEECDKFIASHKEGE